MVIVFVLTSGVALFVWGILNSPGAKRRIAVYEADRLRRWILSRMIEARSMGRFFSIRMTESASPIVILLWGDTGEKEYFDSQEKLFVRKYGLKTNSILSDESFYSSPSSRYCGYNPKWHMFHPGFTLKLTAGKNPKEKAIKFLIVSPLARVRLSDSPP